MPGYPMKGKGVFANLAEASALFDRRSQFEFRTA